MASDPHVRISARVRNTTKVKRKLNAIKGGVAAIMTQKRLENFILKRIHARFEPRGANSQAQRAPDGTPWKQLSTKTRRKVNPNRRQALVDSKSLLRAVKVVRSNMSNTTALSSPTGAGFSIGVSESAGKVAEYAKIHNLGGYAGKGGKVRIPARRYLGISNADVKAVDSLIVRQLRKVL